MLVGALAAGQRWCVHRARCQHSCRPARSPSLAPTSPPSRPCLQGEGGAPRSAVQIRESSGHWVDLALGEAEVAVVLGRTLQHATAGLLRPATHRVVGDPYRRPGSPGAGLRLLSYELRPRREATLDPLRQQLEAAGHTVSTR